MHIQNKSFTDGSREPLFAVGGRPVRVINAVLRIRPQKIPVISLSLARSPRRQPARVVARSRLVNRCGKRL